MRFYEKMIEQFEKVGDQYLMGRLWTVVAYNKHKALIGKSNSFKFIKKKLSWCGPHLTLHIKKTGRITSVFIVSGKTRWDITEHTKWDKPRFYPYRCGEELEIDDLIISLQTY